MIPLEILIEISGYACEPWGRSSWYSSAPATEESVTRIQRELGIIIPQEFILLSQQCPSYGGWFASIGEDYDGPVHILGINAAFHEDEEQPVPEHLILLNHGHDGDCDCWDTRSLSEKGEHPILYFDTTSPERQLPDYRFACFQQYLEKFCLSRAPRLTNKAHQKRAIELLGPYM